MSRSSSVFACLRAFASSWTGQLRHRGRFSAVRLTVVALVMGLATLSVAALSPEIASAAASPDISAPPDVVVGEAGGSVILPVTLSAASTSTVTVDYDVPGGGGCDYLYQGKSGTLTFSPGVTSQSVIVTLNNCGERGIGTFPNFTFNLSRCGERHHHRPVHPGGHHR